MQAMLEWLHDQGIHPLNMPLTHQKFSKTFEEESPFCMCTTYNFTAAKLSNPRGLIRLPVSASPVGLTLTRNWERHGESRDSFQQIFRWLLRNKMNEVTIYGIEVKVNAALSKVA